MSRDLRQSALGTQSKVLPTHLRRQAVVYVRQSSLLQVERNRESQARQYHLVERAQTLGWVASQCLVVDEDLGLSGAQSHNRPGYQRLISLIALREVGLILGLEVSRLARNSLDWYQLLDLAAAFDVLIADEDGLYDPGEFNDRLLLGLKGTISEVELYQIRARMVRGRLNKARRGELQWQLPVGFERDPLTGAMRLSTDESVRHSLDQVFALFRQVHSIRGVLLALYRAGLELPYRQQLPGLPVQIAWRAPVYDEVYALLRNPIYAGVYCYGRRRQARDPLAHTTHVYAVDRSQWEAFLLDHHPGYICWVEFEENQRVLAHNRTSYAPGPGAVRKGPALLQGLVRCQHCGQRMRVRYSHGEPYYLCDVAHRRFGEPLCTRASAKRVDALVEELFLQVVQAGTLDLSLAGHAQLQEEQARLERSWQEKFTRLEYAAHLAQRRYELVDPENRLVAKTLEAEWNARLVELEAAQQEYAAHQVQTLQPHCTDEQLRQVIMHLPEEWYAADLTPEERKELLRCLIETVTLHNQGKVIRTEVHWFGGAVSALEVPKYLFSAPALYRRVRDLAQQHTDSEIARRLNDARCTTVKGRPWTTRRVLDFRLSNAIPSGFTTNAQLRTPHSGYLTSAEVAVRLGVRQATVQHWYRLGVLSGKHDRRQAQLWIHWTAEVGERLTGAGQPRRQMVSVRALCRQQGQSPEAVLAWAQREGHAIYRLRRGTAMRFYILPATTSVPSK